jgi:hypothetical protein
LTLIVDTGGLMSVLDGNQEDHELFLEAVQQARPRWSSPRWSWPSWTTSFWPATDAERNWSPSRK